MLFDKELSIKINRFDYGKKTLFGLTSDALCEKVSGKSK